MADTEFTALRDPLRAILGDFSATFPKYQDAAIDSVLKAVLLTGQVPGYATNSGQTGVTPALATPKDYASLLYRAALMFVAPNCADYSYATRAIKEKFGHQRDFLLELHHLLYQAEFPAACASWSNLSSWLTGITGLNLFGHLTEMDTKAPVAHASINISGLTVNQA